MVCWPPKWGPSGAVVGPVGRPRALLDRLSAVVASRCNLEENYMFFHFLGPSEPPWDGLVARCGPRSAPPAPFWDPRGLLPVLFPWSLTGAAGRRAASPPTDDADCRTARMGAAGRRAASHPTDAADVFFSRTTQDFDVSEWQTNLALLASHLVPDKATS